MASASAKKVNYRTYGSLAYDVNTRAEEYALTGSAAEFERRVHAELLELKKIQSGEITIENTHKLGWPGSGQGRYHRPDP